MEAYPFREDLMPEYIGLVLRPAVDLDAEVRLRQELCRLFCQLRLCLHGSAVGIHKTLRGGLQRLRSFVRGNRIPCLLDIPAESGQVCADLPQCLGVLV